MKYGFIGAGNMASAIIKGMLKNKVAQPGEIIIYDVDPQAVGRLCTQTGVTSAESNLNLVNSADCVVLCVKPHILPSVLEADKGAFKKPLIISIVAGAAIESIEAILGQDIRLCRVMPNINAEVLESMSAICYNSIVTEADKAIIEKIFNSIGKTVMLSEKYIAAFAGIAGCSPAFTYLFIESLAKAAHKNGLAKNEAIKIAAQAVYGSAKMALESNEHPNVLIDKVCSPGGTTIEGIITLDSMGFQSAIVSAVEATVAKDSKLSQNQ
ncbi:MAG: pyrroline-5-carboxylate reductase [Clostridiales bacterium]|jgi:pyrroline-5-carboxylate reductase|nr:pyrroline-5-carboxylate reductase [Clostridiales bacterium]